MAKAKARTRLLPEGRGGAGTATSASVSPSPFRESGVARSAGGEVKGRSGQLCYGVTHAQQEDAVCF